MPSEEFQYHKEALISNESVVQMLAERCRTLEQANKKLQSEARAQQQQYEVCLDRVATQVVQALLSQKVMNLMPGNWFSIILHLVLGFYFKRLELKD